MPTHTARTPRHVDATQATQRDAPAFTERRRWQRDRGLRALLLSMVGVLGTLAGCASFASRTTLPDGATTAPLPGPALPEGVEAVSLLGTPFRAPRLPTTAVTSADSALAASPNDPERLLAAALARANAWRFREAIARYGEGVERWPDDARFLRFRGHRYITVRQFADGARDLDRAAVLDSTNFDVVYHQGLAHFLLGDYARAAAAYDKCLGFSTNAALRAREAAGGYRRGYRSCMRIATDDDARVAMTDWAWRAHMRAGNRAAADRLLDTIRETMTVNTNRSYHENLLMYQGRRTPAQVMQAAGPDSVRFSTSGYAVASYHLVRGDSAAAWAMFDRVARSPHWSGFGVIGAEVELARRAGRAVR
jgi:tetratricopeptide (TPR) repeat protein